MQLLYKSVLRDKCQAGRRPYKAEDSTSVPTNIRKFWGRSAIVIVIVSNSNILLVYSNLLFIKLLL